MKKLIIKRFITTALTLALILGMLPSVPFFVLAEDKAASPQEPPETEGTVWEDIESTDPGSPEKEKREPSENIEEAYLTPLSMEEFEELIKDQPEQEIEDIEAYIERVYNEDGSVTENYFFEPIKYKDENEEWQYINPAIKEQSTPDGEAIYVSDESDVKIEFAGNNDETTTATVRKGEHTVTLQPVESESGPAPGNKRTLFIDTGYNTVSIQEMVRGNTLSVDTPGNLNTSKNSTNPIRETKEDSLQEIKEDSTFKEESYDAIKFEGMLGESTDVVFHPSGGGLKEDIILNEYTGQEVYSFELGLDNLYPVQREDNTVFLLDNETDEIIATIPFPWMVDSSEDAQEVFDIEVRIRKKSESTYIYEMLPCQEWLSDPGRLFPVKIDPSLNFYNIPDMFVSSSEPNRNFTNFGEGNIKVGRDSAMTLFRGFWDLTSIMNGMGANWGITAAHLHLYQTYTSTPQPSYSLYTVAGDYNRTTITWNNQPGAGTYLTTTQVGNNGWYSWNFTERMKTWYSNPNAYIKKLTMRSSTESAVSYKRFASSWNSITSYRAYVSITYNAPPAGSPGTVTLGNPTKVGTTANMSVTFSSVNTATSYEVRILRNGVVYKTADTTALSYTFTGLPDSSPYVAQVMAKNNLGGSNVWSSSNTVNVGDYTPPAWPPNSSITVSPTGWTNGNITITHTQATDISTPITYQYAISGSNKTAPTTYTDLPANKILVNPTIGVQYVWIRAVDKAGNIGTPLCSSTPYSRVTAAPVIPDLSIPDPDPNNIMLGIAAKITTAMPDAYSGWRLEYGMGANTSNMIGIIAEGASLPGGQVIYSWDTNPLKNNEVYTIKLTAYDKAGNSSTKSVNWRKARGSDLIPAELRIGDKEIIIGAGGPELEVSYTGVDENLSYTGAELIVNSRLAGTQQGSKQSIVTDGLINYPDNSLIFMYIMAKDSEGDPIYSHDSYSKHEPLLSQGSVTTHGGAIFSNGIITLTGTDGYADTDMLEFPGDISFIDLIVNETKPAGSSITYQISVDGGAWMSITPVSTDGGATYSYAYRKYLLADTSSEIAIRVNLNKGAATTAPSVDMMHADIRYLMYEGGDLIDNGFEKNSRGFTALDNVTNVRYHPIGSNGELEEEDGFVTLIDLNRPGSVESTRRRVAGDIIEVKLITSDLTHPGTSITYEISTNGGTSYETITPTTSDGAWTPLTNTGASVVLRATLDAGAGGVSPELHHWFLQVKAALPGEGYRIETTVAPPTSLSAFPGANYQTLLRWAPSETQENITYNVYRSDTPYFVPSPETLVAEGLNDCYWYDFRLEYGQQFYYYVTAVMQAWDYERESVPSNQTEATVVSESELDKMLGLQNYWTFTQFSTGSGTGYINVANGNFVYIASDMVIPDPFFAMVMRRTYNSLADSKTAMGYGWDFSFNTTLMREFDPTSGNEIGMILKDGDGTLHRFALDPNGTYQSAKGTFMELKHVENAGEYTITRKDNITYHFDDQSMMLKSFTDLNGNTMALTYDDRGNVTVVENTVGDKLELKYKVQRINGNSFEEVYLNSEDYIYVNDCVDMLESVNWVSQTDNSYELEYKYEYEDDRLISAWTKLAPRKEYVEIYEYASYSNTTHKRMKKIINPEGKEYGLIYTTGANTASYDRVSRVNYPEPGTFLNLSYSGNTTAVSDEAGHIQTYTVNSANGLVSSTSKPGVSYTYTNNYQIQSASYQNYVSGVLCNITESYEYDKGNLTRKSTSVSGGGVVSDVRYLNYNEYNQPGVMREYITTGSFRDTVFSYNYAGGRLQSVQTADPSGKISTDIYGEVNGSFGYLVSRTDRNGKYTRYEYDSLGRVKTVTERASPSGSVYTQLNYTYDEYGRTKETWTTGMNDKTEYTYSRMGLLTNVRYANNTEEEYDYSLTGDMLEKMDTENVITSYTYDDNGRLRSTTYAAWTSEGYTKEISYQSHTSTTGLAPMLVTTDNMGRQSKEYYNADRMLEKSVAGGATTLYQFDLMGNVTLVTNGDNNVTRIEYDALGRRTLEAAVADANKVRIAAHGQKGTGYDTALDLETKNTYNMVGNNLATTNGENVTTSYTYDNLNRLTSVTQPLDSGSNAVTRYAYDQAHADGIANVTRDARNNVSSTGGLISESVFNNAGQKVKDISRDPGSNKRQEASYTYDSHGNVTSVLRNDGSFEKHTYDNMGKLLRVDYYTTKNAHDTGQAPGQRIAYSYYANSSRLKSKVASYPATDPGGNRTESIHYSYTISGQVSQYRQESGSLGAFPIDYTYNRAGQITSVRYPKPDTLGKANPHNTNLHIIWYEYDAYGRLAGIYKDEGVSTTKVKTSNARLVRSYAYTAGGKVLATYDYRNFSAGGNQFIELAYIYNGFGLPTSMTYTDVNGSTRAEKERHALVYDKNGAITGETITERYSGIVTNTKTYTYDLAGRLKTATHNNATTTYAYDAAGNRTQQVKGNKTHNYEYNYLNHLERIKDGSTLSVSYEYDALGNQTEEKQYIPNTSYTQTTSYSYDLLNQMNGANISQTWPGANPVSLAGNAYNAEGKRVSRVESNGAETRFYYMGDALLFTTNGAYLLETENILDLSGEIIASRRFDFLAGQPNDYFFYNYDARGSVSNIVNNAGNRVKGYDYDEYGNLSGSSGNFKNEVTYTGYVSDNVTGLYYANSRYYNPATGRFLTQDAYTGNAGEPWTQNLYTYCGNNPINFIDPTGHCRESPRQQKIDCRCTTCQTSKSYIKPTAREWIGNVLKSIPSSSSERTENGTIKIGPNKTSITAKGASETTTKSFGPYSNKKSVTVGYAEGMLRAQLFEQKLPEPRASNTTIGGFAKVSILNTSRKDRIGTENFGIFGQSVLDIGVATGQTGVQAREGAGVAMAGRASVASLRFTWGVDVLGYQAEVGAEAHGLTAGREFAFGQLPDGGWGSKGSIPGILPYSFGYIIRFVPPS